MLRDAGIQAVVVENLPQVRGGSINRKPQGWIERSDSERAGPVLADYQRRAAERRAAEQASAGADGPRVEAVCEECGKRSEFPVALRGTVQSCPHCGASLDVGD